MRKTSQKDIPPLPSSFLDRMKCLLKEDYAAFLASYDEAPSIGLRVNTLKISVKDFCTISAYPLTPVPWCPSGFFLKETDLTEHIQTPSKHPFHAAGLYYLQEPSAMLPAEMLNPQPHERVLDLAAAPGGKTTHMVALMQNQGVLVANEIHPKRVWELVKNLERCGVCNTIVTNENPEQLAKHLEGYFDKVLVDAPCSGEGMFRKNPDARKEWSPKVVQGCAIRQRYILNSAAKLVRLGGYLLYSTCTFSVEENEEVVTHFLTDHPEFEVVEVPKQDAFLPGRPDWVQKEAPTELVHAIRLMPHKAPGEGHFAVLLRKRECNSTKGTQPFRPPLLSNIVMKTLTDFCQATLTEEGKQKVLGSNQMVLVGAHLYRLPTQTPDLRGLRVIRPGLLLGKFAKGRFEPSHAMSRYLTPQDVQSCLPLSLEDPRLDAYLRGEDLLLHEENSTSVWMMVALLDYSLGWGKTIGKTLKNYYARKKRWI